ncbi:MAG TPA: HAD-IA family hydrolase [Patescibacteria group bacterium]|nr:HAD-IA family hydrolase [Patescibacteria group bacterium]
MLKALLFDLSYTLLFPRDKTYHEELNKLHKELKGSPTYIPSEYYYLDYEILEFLKSFKGNYKFYIFTSGSIQNIPEFHAKLKDVFNEIFSAGEMGLSKKDPEAYKTISKALKVEPAELLFIDDIDLNCKAAAAAGLKTYQYQNTNELIEFLNNLKD